MNTVRLSIVLLAALHSPAAGFVQQASAPAADDLEAILAGARRLYQEALDTSQRDERLARFHQARLQFDRLVTAGVRDADLYTDIGNAALQAEDLGSAVLAYRRALRLDPDHTRALQNLDHARSLLPTWVPRAASGGALDSFFFWQHTWSPDERTLRAGLAFAVALLLLAAAVRFRRPLLRNLAVLPALAWCVLVTSSWFAGGVAADAVVFVPGGEPALSADAPNARAVYSNPLPAGTEVTMTEQRGDWVQIRLADDSRTAWVRAGSIAPIDPDTD